MMLARFCVAHASGLMSPVVLSPLAQLGGNEAAGVNEADTSRCRVCGVGAHTPPHVGSLAAPSAPRPWLARSHALRG
jgi:hypothetical protein